MGNTVPVDKFSEVFVYRDEDSILRSRPLQQSPVTGILAEDLCFEYIVPVVA